MLDVLLAMNSQAPTVSFSFAALAIALLTVVAPLYALIKQWRSGKPRDHFYEDADGAATPETIVNFSNKAVKTALLLFSIVGLGTSAGSLTLVCLHKVNHGSVLKSSLHTATWGIICICSACIIAHRSSVKCHDLGVLLSICTSLFTIPIVFQLIDAAARQRKDDYIPISFLITNVIAALGLVITGILFPRRPGVVFDKREVDQQWTVSALNRYTWSWIQPLLRHAALHNDIDVDDLPQADSELRSQTLGDQWDKLSMRTSLIRSLLRVYRRKILILWSATIVRCVVSIVPFWFMLRILSLLEAPTARPLNIELLALIFAMAISNLLDSWIEGWLYWYSISSIALPVRTQLSALIFNKALKRKNVQDATRQDNVEESEHDEDSGQESPQSVVNLVGVDTERIATCLQYHFMILNGVVKLVIFSAFLLNLLGWIPFAAGILAWTFTLPLNTWFSKNVYKQSRRVMKLRDTRLSKINEMLLGMRHIKFSALELQWETRILALRNLELKALWGFLLADAGLFACWIISPILLAVTTLSAYVYTTGSLLPSITFVSIGLFNSLEVTLGSLPELFTLVLDSMVSLRRIDAYLHQSERQNVLLGGPMISFEGASISWPVDESNPPSNGFVIRDINISFPHGALSVVCGKVGTGKSLLLSAILGDSELLNGSITVPTAQAEHHKQWVIPGSIAYVSQVPWLESTSLRNNILFGLPYDKKRYDRVLTACALWDDLAILPDYDDTEIGADGVNLSGGQKWRISLARAVYSRAEILVMEDIFSAVDTRVGAHIFEKCLTGDICKGRTRILATHHLSLVIQETSYLVELGENRVLYSGPPNGRAGYEDLESERSDTDINDPEPIDSERRVSFSHQGNGNEHQKADGPVQTPRKFMQEELRQKGTVKRSIYLTYIKSSGSLLFWLGSLSIYFIYQAGIIGRAWWLRIWTHQATIECVDDCVRSNFRSLEFSDQGLMHRMFGPGAFEHELLYYLKIYIAISVGTAAIGVLRYVSSYYLSVRSSKTLFKKMLFTVMHVPLRWLDTVPKGQILNRFTADFNIIDERLIMSWSLFFSNLLRSAGICIASCFASAYLILPATFLLGVGMFIGNKYLIASRPLKRLESNARSPVFELFQTTLVGISTIRAFRRIDAYITQMHHNLDAWAMTSFYIALTNRWMSFRMALIATVFTIIVGLVITFRLNDAALAGLVLSFVLDFSESLRWTIRCYGDMELEMNAMERVTEYTSLEMESLEGSAPPAAWPTSGRIDFHDLEVAYAPDLPPVLKGLSFKIEDNQKIGVVGRTGAGKSSLTLALFRLLESRSGSIMIDGMNISKMPLRSLRTQLSIIPQQPVLYSGTIRSNLDPFDLHTDYELYDALSRIHLEDSPSANAQPTSNSRETNPLRDLSDTVSESGSNLSQGQQQLLCIARALLTKSKIVVLDEATSAIDRETDNLIQQNMLAWFKDRTLIVIAHRLSTVASFDKILVLDEGRLVEYDTPKALWEKKGVFRSMCDRTGEKERESLRKSIFGELI